MDELEPLFSVYFDTPQGKVVDLDKSKKVTLDNIKSLSHDQYKTHKLNVVKYREAQGHHASLKRYNQHIEVIIEDIYQLISESTTGHKTFSLEENNKPVTLSNLCLLVGSRDNNFIKLRKVAEQRLIYWRKLGLTPLFTLTQLTKHIEQLGYKLSSCRKEQIEVNDNSEPLNLSNVSLAG
ncbi:MAG: hypothetical protein MJK12_17530 [Colwellia sp.]|nr:hypothetical protein [Colwellia sp.]